MKTTLARLKHLALLPALPFSFALACDDGLHADPDAADAADVADAESLSRYAAPLQPAAHTARLPAEAHVAEGPSAPVVAHFAGARTPAIEQVIATSLANLEADMARAQDLAFAGLRPAPSTRWLVDQGRVVVKSGEAIQPSWLVGAPELVKSAKDGWDGDGLFLARRALDVNALPLDLRALAGVEVKVFDLEREVCLARIAPEPGLAGFAVQATLVNFPNGWDGEDAPIPTHDAQSVFDQGLSVLSASLVPLSGDCSKGRWAAPVEAPRPDLFKPFKPSAELRQKAIAAFRKLPAWADAQHEMLTFFADAPADARAHRAQRWDSLDGAKPEVVAYRADSGREVVIVSADSWNGCGSEGQQMVSVLEVKRDGKALTFASLGALPWTGVPEGLVDWDADGTLEIHAGYGPHSQGRYGGTLIERWHPERPAPSEQNDYRDERHEPLLQLELPDLTSYGCPC